MGLNLLKANLPSRERILEELRDIMKKLPFGFRRIRLDMFYLALHVIGKNALNWIRSLWIYIVLISLI